MYLDMTVDFILNTFALICGWLSCSMAISSTASVAWYTFSIFNVGLWQFCNNNNGNCFSTSGGSYLAATQAFMILTVIFAFFASIIHAVSMCVINRRMRMASALMHGITGVFGLIASTVYFGVGKPVISWYYGWGYAFAWTSTFLSFTCLVLIALTVRKIFEDSQKFPMDNN